MIRLPQPRDEKGRFIAQPNTDCVPVPRVWLERLLSIAKDQNSYERAYIKGYIESAIGFLTKEK